MTPKITKFICHMNALRDIFYRVFFQEYANTYHNVIEDRNKVYKHVPSANKGDKNSTDTHSYSLAAPATPTPTAVLNILH
jgi:hypothetical protein